MLLALGWLPLLPGSPRQPRRVRLSLNKNTADQLKIELPAKMVLDAGEVFP